MAKEDKIAFLCKRLKELREKNHCTMDEMVQKLAVNGIAPNKSSVSRVEEEKTSEKTMIEPAKKYCEACLLPTDSEKTDRSKICPPFLTFSNLTDSSHRLRRRGNPRKLCKRSVLASGAIYFPRKPARPGSTPWNMTKKCYPQKSKARSRCYILKRKTKRRGIL